jgi:transposase
VAKTRRKYSPEFKFRVVMEVFQSDKPLAEIARAYDVHPVTVSNWKRHFEEHGAEVFGGKEEVKMYEKQLGDLERMLGKKEVEIALLKNILGER